VLKWPPEVATLVTDTSQAGVGWMCGGTKGWCCSDCSVM